MDLCTLGSTTSGCFDLCSKIEKFPLHPCTCNFYTEMPCFVLVIWFSIFLHLWDYGSQRLQRTHIFVASPTARTNNASPCNQVYLLYAFNMYIRTIFFSFLPICISISALQIIYWLYLIFFRSKQNQE